ncbi:MAG: hypothetical protein WAU23_03415, partial [Ferruginibacter sp.]
RTFLASLGIELTPVIVSVIGDQPSHQQLLACQARNTVCRTVPKARPTWPARTSSKPARRSRTPSRTAEVLDSSKENHMISSIISAIVVGALIGALGRLVVRGKQHISILVTIVIGIIAALIGSNDQNLWMALGEVT